MHGPQEIRKGSEVVEQLLRGADGRCCLACSLENLLKQEVLRLVTVSTSSLNDDPENQGS